MVTLPPPHVNDRQQFLKFSPTLPPYRQQPLTFLFSSTLPPLLILEVKP